MVALTALTGTSITFEFDTLDDSGTPVSLALWNSGALTSATKNILVSIGPGVAFVEAATAPANAPTGFGMITAPTNWTYYLYPFTIAPNGQFQWTVSSVTAASWTAWIYGIN